MEFENLQAGLSDSQRAELTGLDRKQAEERIRMLESIWPGKAKALREKLMAAIGQPENKRAQPAGELLREMGKETGSLCGARFLRAYWDEKKQPLPPPVQAAQGVEQGFAECVSMAAAALEACTAQNRQLPGPEYRQLQDTLEKYENTKKATLFGMLLPAALFTAIWVLLIRWMGTPGFASFVAKPVWEEVSYAAFLVLFFVFGFCVMAVGGGLIGGVIGGVVLDVLAMLFSIYVFGPLMTKLIPALGGVASGYVYLLVFLLALALVLLTFFCGLVPFLSHFGAVSKKSRLKNLCKKLKRLLPALAEERQIYGRLVDMSVICEAKMRWEDASYAGLPRGEASYRKLRAVRDFFRELCRCYDRAQTYLAEREA